jgi:aldehyde dehydrogenase (NAD+)
VRPTIFASVDPQRRDRTGGDLRLGAFMIPYRTEDEAVEIANSTIYALSGAVFGEDEHALAITRRLRTGKGDINGARFKVLAPFGGYKQSGQRP